MSGRASAILEILVGAVASIIMALGTIAGVFLLGYGVSYIIYSLVLWVLA